MTAGGALLVLLHGLGGNRAVWDPLIRLLPGSPVGAPPKATAARGPGWLALDLPGHGAAAPLPAYTYRACAEAVAAAIPGHADVTVLGHSFGGVVGLALAALRPVRSVVTVGMRAQWPAEFVATLAGLAAKPPRQFHTREQAAAFLLRINALDGLLGPDSGFARHGTAADTAEGWGLRNDPRTYRIGAPPFDDLLAAAGDAGTTMTLAHGETDPMVAIGDYDELAARHGARIAVLPGLGHNAHVQDPAAVLGLLRT